MTAFDALRPALAALPRLESLLAADRLTDRAGTVVCAAAVPRDGVATALRTRQAARKPADRAAKAGSVSSLNNLAALYENGQGVKRSQAEAAVTSARAPVEQVLCLAAFGSALVLGAMALCNLVLAAVVVVLLAALAALAPLARTLYQIS